MIIQVNGLTYILEYGNVIWVPHCALDQCKLRVTMVCNKTCTILKTWIIHWLTDIIEFAIPVIQVQTWWPNIFIQTVKWLFWATWTTPTSLHYLTTHIPENIHLITYNKPPAYHLCLVKFLVLGYLMTGTVSQVIL